MPGLVTLLIQNHSNRERIFFFFFQTDSTSPSFFHAENNFGSEQTAFIHQFYSKLPSSQHGLAVIQQPRYRS